jgi:hypothetical protein
MESIIQQAPEGISTEYVEELYKTHNGDVPKILGILWEMPDVKNTQYDNEDTQKWNNIRDICNAYEEEMNKFMQESLKQNKKT